MTPEEKRDQTVAAIEMVGGVVLGCDPLAAPETPHEVAAYRIRAGARTLTALQALKTIQAETQVTAAGLIPWTPEPVEGGDEE